MNQGAGKRHGWLWMTRPLGRWRWTTPIVVLPIAAIFVFLVELSPWIFTASGTNRPLMRAGLTVAVAGLAIVVVVLIGRRTVERHSDEQYRLALEWLRRSAAAQRRALRMLENLGRHHKDMRENVVELLCSHIRDTTIEPEIRDTAIRILRLHRLRLRRSWWDVRPLNLAGADLTAADLSRMDLSEARLTGAKLHMARLSDADLTNANLSRADLSRANLTRAQLFGANLEGANMRRTALSQVDLTNVNLRGVDLSGIVHEDPDSKHYHHIPVEVPLPQFPLPHFPASQELELPRTPDISRLFPDSSIFGVSVYLDTSDQDRVNSLLAALRNVFETENLVIEPVGEPQISSFFQKFWIRAKDAASTEEVRSRLAKLEMALELRALDQPMSEVNVNQAQAVSELIGAVEKIDNAVLLSGSAMVVKWTDSDGSSSIFAKTLSPLERKAIDDSPHLLKKPRDALEYLHQLPSTSQRFGELGDGTSSAADPAFS